MAQTAATKLSDFTSGFLPPHLAAPIFQKTAQMSVVQRLARQVPLSIGGESIPVVTGRPTAGWVDEAAQKPASTGSLDLKTMSPKKIAAITAVSQEVMRADPGGYLGLWRDDIATAFAIAFDRAALHDEGPTGGAGGGPFTTYLDQTTKVQELGSTTAANGGVNGDFAAALGKVQSDTDNSGRRYYVNGWALDLVVEASLWSAVDTTGQPVLQYLPIPQQSATVLPTGMLVGRQALLGEGIASANLTAVVGYGGDWTQAAWGVIGGVNFSVSTEASVTLNGSLVSAFENNLVILRAEAEFGWVVADPEAFIKITNTNNTPITSS